MKSVRNPAVMIAITRFGILFNVIVLQDPFGQEKSLEAGMVLSAMSYKPSSRTVRFGKIFPNIGGKISSTAYGLDKDKCKHVKNILKARAGPFFVDYAGQKII
jgi:hypothetical protein